MAEDKPKRGVGRPRAQIDDHQLKALCRLKPTLSDVSGFFDISEDAIRDYIKREYNCDFTTFRNKYVAQTRYMLIRKAIKMAENGNTAMMIFCLKNLCKWADKVEHSDVPANTLQLAYSLDKQPKQVSGDVIDAEAEESNE